MTQRVFMDLTIDGEAAGRLVLGMFGNTVPKTVGNFVGLATGNTTRRNGAPLTFQGTKFHRIIPGFMLQGGDFTCGDGTGGESIYGGKFNDENFIARHSRPGMLSMANAGRNTNGSQFFITTVKCPHLDGKHVVFGRVVSGVDIVQAIENTEVDDSDKPLKACTITASGELPALTGDEDASDAP